MNIIVSSFEDGSYIDEISEYQRCKVALNLLCLVHNMCMVDNFMHGDLHIKNWKVRPYNKTYQSNNIFLGERTKNFKTL